MRFCCGRCSAALTTMSLNAGSYDMRFLGFPLGEGGAFGRMLASRACGIDDGRGFLCFFRFSHPASTNPPKVWAPFWVQVWIYFGKFVYQFHL